MTIFSRLRKRQDEGQIIEVAITGAGLIGAGMARQIDITPGMRAALIVNRTVERAVRAYLQCGYAADQIVISNETNDLHEAVRAGRPAVTQRIEMLRELPPLDAVIEVTGAVAFGAQVALHAIAGGKHIIMMNAETDATVGCILKRKADDAGVVYTNADGDQPGVLKRLVEYVQGLGFDITAAVNCKGFMDVQATPDSIRPWAEKQNTSLSMTTAFTDGTKMNIENAVLCNSTGLTPEMRGMHGIKTTQASALEDFVRVLGRRGVVDYTLGGDFGGGVFVIGHADDPITVRPYMEYLKMGGGPEYLFFRPYHLCHFESPISVAEAVLDAEPTIAPRGAPVVEVVTIAKRDLAAGEQLDGIGGYTVYGEIEIAEQARELLPIGMSDGAVLTRAIPKGHPIPASAVELDEDSVLSRLRRAQGAMSFMPSA